MRVVLGFCALLVLAAAIATVAGTRRPEPEKAVADDSGDYPVEINYDSDLDPGGHGQYIDMPENMALHMEKEDNPDGSSDVTITGPAPWVTVRDNGAYDHQSCFFPIAFGLHIVADGFGTVAGYQNVRVRFTGELEPGGLAGNLEMGLPSGTPVPFDPVPTPLPGGQVITYSIKPKDGPPVCQQTPAPTRTATQPATATQPPSPPTATQPAQPTATVPPPTPTCPPAAAGQQCPATPVPTATPTSVGPAPTATDRPGNGDVNKDGRIDSVDALLILQFDAGLFLLDARGVNNGDTNRDGPIDSRDAALVLQLSAGLIPVLPVPPR